MNERQRPTLGFIIPEVRTQVNAQIWAGAVDAARSLDINLIGFSGYELQRPDAFKAQGNVIYDLVSAENVDGLVLWTNALCNFAGPEAARTLYEQFPAVPTVELEIMTPVADSYSYRAMGALIRHLIDTHGCRQIAFIRGPVSNQEAENRYQAYRDVLQMEHLAVDPARIVLADDWFKPSGKKAIRIFVEERHAAFDAVVAANDLLAMGALQELQHRGFRVPQDVVVTGFDDIADAQCCTPPLTTARYPLYEMGWQAIETLAAEIAGEAFERVPSPVQLQRRYSCGCLPHDVLQAAVGATAAPDGPFEVAFATRRKALLDTMQLLGKEIGVAAEWMEHLLDTCLSSITDGGEGDFLAIVNDALEHTLTAGGDVAKWQGIMSELSHQLLPCVQQRSNLLLAEDLLLQARMLIGEATARSTMSQALVREQQNALLFDIADRLVSTFNIAHVTDILAQELPRLQIPSCYLSLYEDPQSPTDVARLILAYTEQGRVALAPTGRQFPARNLVPEPYLPQDRQYTLILQALYFHEQQIGFALFEVSPDWKNVYETLCGLISSTLQGALLVEQVEERSIESARQKYILDTFMATVPDSIYFKDRDSRMTHANMAHARQLGLTDPAEELGKSDFDFFPEPLARIKYAQEQEIIRTGQPIISQEECNEEGRWELSTKMPLRDEHGTIIGTFGISRDITALKDAQAALEQAYADVEQRVVERTAELQQEVAQRIRAEDEIRTLNAELEHRVTERTALLEAANKELRDFAYITSHDLKAPLRGIAHLAQWLAEDYHAALDDKGREMTVLLVNRVKRLENLIEGILQYSRIGRTETTEEPVDLHHVVPAVIDSLSVPGHIQITIESPLPIVHCNQTRMIQVFQNVIGNAVKFLDKPQGKISITCQDHGHTWLFRITDNGPGIEARHHERIFKIFQTLVPRDQHESTGIGLTVVKKIVELYKGQIWVESTQGEGATFAFTLPKT